MPEPRRDALRWLAEHPVAANLVLALMLLSGFYAVAQLNTQFFPDFELGIVTIEVPWTGATAEDVATSLTRPIEDEVRDVEGLREMESTSTDGLASITLEFDDGTNMTEAVEAVKNRVAGIRNLPEDAEEPTIRRPPRFDPIARVAVSGDVPARALRAWAQEMEDELLRRGVADVRISGMPELEAAIAIDQRWLLDSGLTLGQLGSRLASESVDLPGGEVGTTDIARQLRLLEQRRSVEQLADLELRVGDDGLPLRLGDMGSIELQPRERQVQVRHGDLPAIEMLLQRAQDQDSLEAAKILERWYADMQQRLPESLELTVYDQFWELVKERIGLLLSNGLAGLLLVIAILFTFLTVRVAFWVAVGVPAAFLAALAVLWLLGGSINMMSLFALIMTLGIIVDDAIVVGERGVARFEGGEAPGEAAAGGARDMLAPVMASSLTTVAAFIPLMAIGGTMGNIMFDIPLVVICVIIASLIEAFLVLPGHLRRSFEEQSRGRRPTRLRQRVEGAFDGFRFGIYRRWVSAAVRWRWATVASASALLIAAMGLLAGGRIGFTFFPEPEGTVIYANVGFAPGTPTERVKAFVDDIEQKLTEVDEQLAEQQLVRSRVVRLGETYSSGGGRISRGDHYAGVVVELISPEKREVRNSTILSAWQERIERHPGLERLVMRERVAGPPGEDVNVRLSGAQADVLRSAANDLRATLSGYSGIQGIDDDLPYGQEQWVYSLNSEGRALGLSAEDIGRQIRNAFAGNLAQIYYRGRDEVEVRLQRPLSERDELSALFNTQIRLPEGGFIPLQSVVDLESRRGFEVLRHYNGELAVTITANVDEGSGNAGDIRDHLRGTVLPQMEQEYGIDVAFGGRADMQQETLGDMQSGLLLALGLIYLVLAWVFASYGWPLLVMAVIPFGVVGALVGHWLMGIDLTLLSLFGLFGLTGITVNNAIILVIFYRQIRSRGASVDEALIQASCQRLRAMILTSLTTIGGLLPLLAETSVQAQFLIPMAAAIAFGLAGATAIVLLLIPALLSIYEGAAQRIEQWREEGGEARLNG